MSESANNPELQELRSEIDRVNAEIAQLLHQRLELLDRIAVVKIQQDIPPYDSHRERHILESLDLVVPKDDKLPWIKTTFQSLLESHRRYLAQNTDQSK